MNARVWVVSCEPPYDGCTILGLAVRLKKAKAMAGKDHQGHQPLHDPLVWRRPALATLPMGEVFESTVGDYFVERMEVLP